MLSVITGGAGFLGSHLCDALLAGGHRIICVDNLSTGSLENIAHCLPQPSFRFLKADVVSLPAIEDPVEYVFHLASPASPRAYTKRAIETLLCGSLGTLAALELAAEKGATMILASTSEVYGDPAVHPQPETYFGNVNPVGPRSMYDEAKRYAEALTHAYQKSGRVTTAIGRIFNTYGPRMPSGDGRVVSTFIDQALGGRPLTVHGSGAQTRSLCFVEDTVRGLLALCDSRYSSPLNIGSDVECTVNELAARVISLTRSNSEIAHGTAVPEDPQRRRPDLSRTRQVLDWYPRIDLNQGLLRTIDWHRSCGSVSLR